jgi:hypothetical protein
MGEIIKFLDLEMKTPEMYGWFHLLSWLITLVATWAVCHFFRNPSEKTVRKILFVTSVTVIFLEIYKQTCFTFSYDGTKITSDYQWYAFPFQFCSTPMYAGLLASLIKNEKVHKALCAYLSTFALFAGTAVMFYPSTVFMSTIGINIQTMVCHGSMIVIGIFLMFSGYNKVEHKTILKAIPVFSIALLTAVCMNEIAHLGGLLKTEEFNMFFISPYCDPSLPVLSLIQPLVPFPAELIIYVIGFSLASYIMILIAMAVKKIHSNFFKKPVTQK